MGPVWLAGGLPDDEGFTSLIGALRGGGRARWGDKIFTATVGRWQGGWAALVVAFGQRGAPAVAMAAVVTSWSTGKQTGG
jgi:hypothetical protein